MLLEWGKSGHPIYRDKPGSKLNGDECWQTLFCTYQVNNGKQMFTFMSLLNNKFLCTYNKRNINTLKEQQIKYTTNNNEFTYLLVKCLSLFHQNTD